MKHFIIAPIVWVCLCGLWTHGECQTSTATNSTTWDSSFFQAFSYRCVGPTRGGRVTAVSGTLSDPATFFMGSTGGGVWKTTDYGQNWKNISDGYFSSPSIGDIAVSVSHPHKMYVGTGSDGLRSNVITGKGVYRSEDQGKSWEFAGLEQTGHIGAVEIHPQHPDTVFVAAIGQAFEPNRERGVFRTYDGGDSWQQVLYIADTVGVADIEFCPDDPNTLYAATWRAERKPWTIISGGMNGGIYKSTDGGDTWDKVDKGLPKGIIGKIDLAVSADDPKRVYALVEAPEGEGGVYRSDDKGESFRLVSTKKELLDRPFYYCNIDANPQNANVLYVNATQFFRSNNAGESWRRLRTPHGDNHDMWINPKDTLIYVQANDGGANITQNNGKTWSVQSNQPTAELYQVEVDDQFPYWLYAGQQDNSTIAVPSLPPYPATRGGGGYWISVGGCETGPAVPKPGNPNIVYANCKGRFGVYDKRTGQEKQYYVGATNIYGHNPQNLRYRFQRVAPIHVSIHNPDVVYHASQFVHKTTDDGVTWETLSPDLTAFEPDKQVISGSPITRDITGEEYYSTIYALRESPIQEGVLWVGSNDGLVHVTQDGGKNWDNVTPARLPAGGRVDCVEPSPHQAGKAYVAILRYQLGDWKPYIYKTLDFGKHWELLTNGKNGLPDDTPTRVVREDPVREGLLYAGTEYGMYMSQDDGASWQSFQQNLPITPITDIKVFRKDLILSTMGRSFWILDNLSPLQQWESPSEESEIAVLFAPRKAYRMRYRGGGNSLPQFPSVGMHIDYYLPQSPEEAVQLEIIGPENRVIRSFTSAVAGSDEEEEEDMATGFFSGGSTPGLTADQGLNRFKWDLRHRGPWLANGDSRRGPMVIPGNYQVRLWIGGKSWTRAFEVHPDPRLAEAGVSHDDMVAQEALSIKVRNLQSKAYQLEEKISQELEMMEANSPKNGETKGKSKKWMRLDQAHRMLVTEEGRYHQPMLIAQLSYLASMLDRSDQRPGKDAYDRATELEKQLEGLAASLGNWAQKLWKRMMIESSSFCVKAWTNKCSCHWE